MKNEGKVSRGKKEKGNKKSFQFEELFKSFFLLFRVENSIFTSQRGFY